MWSAAWGLNTKKARVGKVVSRMRKALRRKRGPSKTITLPATSLAPIRDGYLSLVVIAKDEASYLVEWIEFHKLVGIEHIYLYDNGSTDETRDVLAPYVKSGFVTYLPWASFDTSVVPQYQAYAHALCNFGPLWRWMAFIDVDEFIFPLRQDRLQDVLPAYEALPAVALHWHMFGTSGHKTRPPGLVIDNYTRRALLPPRLGNPDLSKWKSIVDPAMVEAVISPHMFLLKDGRKGAFDEQRHWVQKSTRAQAASRILRLNHYFTRSEEELATKINKGSACRRPTDIVTPKQWAEDRAKCIDTETVTDEAILRFVKPLKERLAFTADDEGRQLAKTHPLGR